MSLPELAKQAPLLLPTGMGKDQPSTTEVEKPLGNSSSVEASNGHLPKDAWKVWTITGLTNVLAGLMGFYFGCLLIWTENLLVPIVAHAVYDALQFLITKRQVEKKEQASSCVEQLGADT